MLYWPVGHLMHLIDALSSAYFPESQSRQEEDWLQKNSHRNVKQEFMIMAFWTVPKINKEKIKTLILSISRRSNWKENAEYDDNALMKHKDLPDAVWSSNAGVETDRTNAAKGIVAFRISTRFAGNNCCGTGYVWAHRYHAIFSGIVARRCRIATSCGVLGQVHCRGSIPTRVAFFTA